MRGGRASNFEGVFVWKSSFSTYRNNTFRSWVEVSGCFWCPASVSPPLFWLLPCNSPNPTVGINGQSSSKDIPPEMAQSCHPAPPASLGWDPSHQLGGEMEHPHPLLQPCSILTCAVRATIWKRWDHPQGLAPTLCPTSRLSRPFQIPSSSRPPTCGGISGANCQL